MRERVRERGSTNSDTCGQGGRGGQNRAENCGRPSWMTPFSLRLRQLILAHKQMAVIVVAYFMIVVSFNRHLFMREDYDMAALIILLA